MQSRQIRLFFLLIFWETIRANGKFMPEQQLFL